jgi:molecular chaperone DnaK (HSP70)
VRLGIDFGTTRIVVAAVDRGNYPVVSFDTPAGESAGWFPALIAVRGGARLYGWQAWGAQADPGVTVIRSIKRFLHEAGPETKVEIGGESIRMLSLLTGLASALHAALRETSSLKIGAAEPLEVTLGVPANANGNQRFLTVEAFRRAGFDVLGLLNEPSAASVEYGHGVRKKQHAPQRDVILVYDLGGGTFDASLVETDEQRHTILASEGISSLGGDDFDDILAELALDAAGISEAGRESITQSEMFRLHEECRQKKEALHPNTRRIAIDLELVREGWPSVSIPVAQFQERCQPLIEETVHAVEDVIAANAAGAAGPVEAVYVIGGASELPMVSRALKEVFGRKVRRSPYTQSATAIGLAIQADGQAGYGLRERFTRFFGVWREAEAGRTIVFDPLFLKGTPLPGAGETPLTVARSYTPAHNIGHFRYLECSHIAPDGRPSGDVTLWDEILFPFDPALSDAGDLRAETVERFSLEPPQETLESYECDPAGAVTVVISNRTAGYERSYRLGRWAVAQTPVIPGKKRARRAAPTSSKKK